LLDLGFSMLCRRGIQGMRALHALNLSSNPKYVQVNSSSIIHPQLHERGRP
jgi:hypothetical protein